MKAGYQTPRSIRGWALRLAAQAAFLAAVLFCAGTAFAQCGVSVAPGETQSFTQGSSGSNTPSNIPASFSLKGLATPAGAGFFDTGQNKVEAVAVIPVGFLSQTASANAQLNYQFCVTGNPNDTVPATISANVYWNGNLFDVVTVSLNNIAPSATITMTLVDLGTGGSAAPVAIASTTVLQTNLSFTGITQINGISNGGTSVNGSAAPVLQGNVVTGHVYSVQYYLECDAPSGLLGGDIGCDFGSDVDGGLTQGPFCSGGCFSQVRSLSVNVGRDIFAEITNGLANLNASVEALRQTMAANNLTAERENAQLLGILNEIRALLSAQTAPLVPRALKTDPSNRPTSPRTPPSIIQQP